MKITDLLLCPFSTILTLPTSDTWMHVKLSALCLVHSQTNRGTLGQNLGPKIKVELSKEKPEVDWDSLIDLIADVQGSQPRIMFWRTVTQGDKSVVRLIDCAMMSAL